MKNSLETRLGVFFFLAIVAAVIILEMIGTADLFRTTYRVNAVFKSAQELKRADPVKMAGVQIGRVHKILLEEGRAKVVMKIEDGCILHTDAIALIKFSGLMGQNFVSIEGGTTNAPIVAEDGILLTREQPDFGTMMAKLENVATDIQAMTKGFGVDGVGKVLGPLTRFLENNVDPLTAMIGNFKIVSDNIAQGKGSIGKLVKDDSLYRAGYTTFTNLEAVSADLKGFLIKTEGMVTNANAILDQVQAGRGTVGKLLTDDSIHRDLAAAVSSLREIIDKINRGEGSVGQLLKDETFLKNAKMTMQKVEKAMEGLEDQGPLSVLGMAVNSLF